ncbi:putative ribonuclease H-like domain-containing protein [Tanacetum coccineum]
MPPIGQIIASISHSLQLLHMDLFRPTSVRSLNHKTYCLVITDDHNRCDNGTEFKNKDVIEFCGSKGIKREYSNARTPQQNGVAKRKNRTLIEAARTMLADSFLPNTFWAEAVSTACYVLNRVLVTKPHNKTPYELITGKIPIISYIRPFGCHVTILNTIDHLGKFDGKSDEGFLVGYSLQSKAFRVYNLETKRVEENLHITFLENKPNVAGKGPTWLFDLDYLTDSMNYQPVRLENRANKHAGPPEANQNAGTKDIINAGDSEKEDESAQDYFVLPIWSSYSQQSRDHSIRNASPYDGLSLSISTNSKQDDSEIPALEDIYQNPTDGIFTNSSYDDEFKSNGMRKEPSFMAQIDEEVYVSHHQFLDPSERAEPLEGLQSGESSLWVTPSSQSLDQSLSKTSHQSDVKRIFRYLKGKPKLGLWYPRVSSIDLEAYSDSDYAGANLDRKSTTGGCQFLGRRLISWQCKKQTIVATSTTEAENPIYHSKTKHIAIRHHFIRDAYEKKLIQVLKIHTDDNVADLLTKAFDVSSTDSAELVPMGKVSTAIETLKKNTAKAPKLRSPTITHSKIMAVLESCPKHNMVAYLEKTEGMQSFMRSLIFLRGVSDQANEIQHLKGQIKKLKKQAKPVITHHRAWMKSVSLKQRLAGKRSLKKNWMQKEYVSKQGRKSAKAEPSVHKDPLFDEILKDT